MLFLAPALALAVVPATVAAPARLNRVDVETARAIRRYRDTTRRLQSLMGMTREGGRELAIIGSAHPSQRRMLALWQARAASVTRRYLAGPRHRAAWLCIHRYEGAWTDGGAPYYGGLQMDISFQQRYAPFLLRKKGTADHWTPLEQMWVAENAYRAGRGFYPWPNTARYCRLI